VNLGNKNTTCGEAFTEFARDRGKLHGLRSMARCDADCGFVIASWALAFQNAMYKLSVLGVSQSTKSGFTDCTAILSSV
jgi:hypothetical protein